jgi:OOP family OmpA-OmpF porin
MRADVATLFERGGTPNHRRRACTPTLAARIVTFGVTFSACVAFEASAPAQTAPSIDVRTWMPSPDPKASLVLEPTTTPGPWQWNVGAWAHYAQDPVVLRDAANGAIRPVAHLVATDLVAGIGLGARASVGIDVPAFLWQDGASSLAPAVVRGGKVTASGVGDVSAIGKVTVVSNDRHGTRIGLGLAVLGAVSIPTGDRASFASDGSVGASARLLGEVALGVGAVRAIAGYSARTPRGWPDGAPGEVTFGNSIPWAIGGVFRPMVFAKGIDVADRQLWEIAAHGALPAGPVAPFGTGEPGAAKLSPALLAIDDRVALGHDRDTYFLVGADIGLDTAIGVPVVRAVASLGWAPRSHDQDADGVPDDVDECPDLPEDRDGVQDADGCPEDDADGDGILDRDDACPIVAGAPSDDPTKNGCPEKKMP